MSDLSSPSAVPVNMPSVAEANNHISDVIRLMPPSPTPSDAKATTLHFQDIIVSEVIPRLCAKVGVSVAAWKKSQLLSPTTSASAEREEDDSGNANPTTTAAVEMDVESRLLPCNVINVVDADGRTAFHWSLSMKRFDVAQALLDAPFNANPLTVDLDGATTLTTACSVDCPSTLLATLLSAAAAAATAAASSSSSTAEGGDSTTTTAVDFFNAQDTAGNTALLYIASRGNTRALKVILAAIPANVFLTYRTVEMKSVGGAKAVNSASADVAPPAGMTGVTITKPAATTTSAESATSTASVAAVSDVAASPDAGPVVATPLLNYPNPFALNKRRQTALHRAIARGASDFVEEFLSWMKRRVATNNVDPSKGPNGSDVVSNKASVRHFINSQDVQGNTALHYAALENNQDLGQLLLRNGADRDIRNKDGQEFWKL